MLPNTLVTNEVKDAAGAEQEFTHVSSNGRQRVFRLTAEAPNRLHRLDISHVESGSGANRVRSSKVGFTLEVDGAADGTIAKIQAYTVVRIPLGNLADFTAPKIALANLMSFLASNGANTTILYDNSGTGASCLINGEI